MQQDLYMFHFYMEPLVLQVQPFVCHEMKVPGQDAESFRKGRSRWLYSDCACAKAKNL